MGTRSTTRIEDEQGNHLVTLYTQYDGYLDGVGKKLADFLKGKAVINGYSLGQSAETHANGMGCLAAQLIAYLKDGIGNVYISNEGDSQEYNYKIYHTKDGVKLRAESEYEGFLFDDFPQFFTWG